MSKDKVKPLDADELAKVRALIAQITVAGTADEPAEEETEEETEEEAEEEDADEEAEEEDTDEEEESEEAEEEDADEEEESEEAEEEAEEEADPRDVAREALKALITKKKEKGKEIVKALLKKFGGKELPDIADSKLLKLAAAANAELKGK